MHTEATSKLFDMWHEAICVDAVKLNGGGKELTLHLFDENPAVGSPIIVGQIVRLVRLLAKQAVGNNLNASENFGGKFTGEITGKLDTKWEAVKQWTHEGHTPGVGKAGNQYVAANDLLIVSWWVLEP